MHLSLCLALTAMLNLYFMPNIHNSHDKYFRLAMEDIRVAKDFFQQYLPKTIAEAVDLNTLKVQKTSFVDEALAASMADILYAVNMHEQPGYLYTHPTSRCEACI